LSSEEGKKMVAEKNLTKEVCPKFINDSAEILEEVLKVR
jgi:hypothetical protein